MVTIHDVRLAWERTQPQLFFELGGDDPAESPTSGRDTRQLSPCLSPVPAGDRAGVSPDTRHEPEVGTYVQ